MDRGVSERRFDVESEGRVVPGLLWTPDAASTPRPLVLIGHGATLHKGTDYIRMLARRLVRHQGFAAAAIDGPVHGDRSPLPGGGHEALWSVFRESWARVETTDHMIADWRAALDALQRLDEVGEAPVGFWGLSMGTIFGLPFVAAEPRIEVAVLGLMGITGPTRERLRSDAARLTCPLFFLLQWDDELVPRDAALALFHQLGSADKRLHAHPGQHTAVPAEAFRATQDFLAKHLGGGTQ